MPKPSSKFVALAFASLLSAPARAQQPTVPTASAPGVAGACAEAVAARIQGRYESVRDLWARFSQTSQVASLGTGAGGSSRSRGEVVFAKPGKMRWSYQEPAPSLVVSDGAVVWIYDPVAREAQRFDAGPGFLSSAAVQFLLGEGQILRDFEVKAKGCGAETVVLDLFPREPAAYERLELHAEAASGEIRESAVFDLVGNVTRVRFEEVRVNQQPAASTFVFEPPAGVRVVEVAPHEP